ncbi:uncharacterized protein LOC142976734 [Anticarsia gemmatalis]|uniref:uncharacterized protein LOC142976734 n=1 Tax=Anticarsia gemmatalis TaxID=129554 RepID=UPI003F765269
MQRRQMWVDLIGRQDLLNPEKRARTYFVCSLHFARDDITSKPILMPNALPSKRLPSEPTSSTEIDIIYKKMPVHTATQTKPSHLQQLALANRRNYKTQAVQTDPLPEPPKETKRNKHKKDYRLFNLKSRLEIEFGIILEDLPCEKPKL